MQSLSPIAPPRRTRASCLHITLSDRLDAAGVDGCINRLAAFLAPFGLAVSLSSKGIAVLRSADAERAVTPFNRGFVVGWLIAQPEFVLVSLERRPAMAHRLATLLQEQAHG